MADEDISLNEDQLLDNLDDGNNGDSEFLNEVRNREIFDYFYLWMGKSCLQKVVDLKTSLSTGPKAGEKKKQNGDDKYKRTQTV